MIPVSKPSVTELEKRYVRDAVESEWISSLGSYVTQFEEKLANFLNVKYALSCSSGTTAIHLAIKAAVKDDFSIALPNFTFVSPYNMAKLCDPNQIYLVEPDLGNKCLDIKNKRVIEQLNTLRPKVILLVHAYGYAADVIGLKNSLNYEPIIIEDCAEAHGANLNGKMVGSLGNIGCFSFYGNKIFSCGEGGAISTDDEELFERAKLLRDHAMDPENRYYHLELGFNYRITNLQAAVGLAQLERADEILEDRNRILMEYREVLNSPAVKINPGSEVGRDVNWLTCLEFENESIDVDHLIKFLASRKIDTRPYFKPISSFPYVNDKILGQVGNSAFLSKKGINLPTFFNMSRQDITYIGEAIDEYFSKLG